MTTMMMMTMAMTTMIIKTMVMMMMMMTTTMMMMMMTTTMMLNWITKQFLQLAIVKPTKLYSKCLQTLLTKWSLECVVRCNQVNNFMENMKHNFHSTNLNLYLYEFDQKKLQISSKYFFTDFFVRTSFLIEFEF